jgi:plasmid stabilization system protein ParE
MQKRGMAEHYLLVKAAAVDLEDIIRHTNAQWGEAQCRCYIDQLETTTFVVFVIGRVRNAP